MSEALPFPPTGDTPRILRNASLLLAAQIVVAPVSVLVNAIAARTLGAAIYGQLFQVMTFASFIMLFVEWGQSNALTARVATDRARAGELLGSGMAFRVTTSLAAMVLAPCVCLLAGYSGDFVSILALMILGGLLGTTVGACQDVFRGFERTDFAAASFVGWQLLSAAAVIPVLLLGGGLHGLILAQLVCAVAGALFVLRMLPRMGVPHLSVRWQTCKELIQAGQPFLWFSLALMIPPIVDAVMLSKFAPAEVMGWQAAARKLAGVLTFPAAALVGALYPTLCRLRAESMDLFRSTTADALYAVTVVAIPMAMGCAFFPELGVWIFGRQDYGPAEDNLRVLALHLLLVYISMPMGSCLASSGRQTAWTTLQFACVIVTAALDAPLIIWFQQHTGNGGLGACAAAVVGEILIVGGAMWLLPQGIFSRMSRTRVLSALLAGAAMAAVALASTPLNIVVRAVLAMLAYCVTLQLSGGLDFRQLRAFLGFMRAR